jgi:hypothetical protein
MRRASALLAVAVAAAGSSCSRRVAPAEQPWVGDPAPAFELPSLDGQLVSLAGLRGKTVVLHFGAGW